MVGKHHVDVFGVLPAQHRVAPFDLAREERHAFVLHRRAIEREEFEIKKVGGFQELRQDHPAVVGRVSGVISPRAVIVVKKNKAGVLDPVALRGGGGE